MKEVNMTFVVEGEVAQWLEYLGRQGVQELLNHLLRMEQEGRIVITRSGIIELF